MTDPEIPRLLVPPATARRIERRSFLAGVLALGGTAALAACGAIGGTVGESAATSPTPSPLPTEVGARLNIYNWAQYDDPELIKKFEAAVKTSTQIDVYSSNEEMIAKLVAAKGSAGYDVVVPSATFVPQMAANGLLLPLDKAQLPNIANVTPTFTELPYDKGNVYSVIKDWGTTGWLYDTTKITRPITNWSEFIAAAQNEASGRTSILAGPGSGTALYFWKDGKRLTGASSADLDAAADFTINQLAPHVRRFDGFPGSQLGKGIYDLSQIYNGDARYALLGVDDPERYRWGVGSPTTEYWTDTWAVPVGSRNPGGAHALINWILDPANSFVDMQYHGYNTGLVGVEAKAKADPEGFPLPEMVFFTEAQVAGWEALEQDENWSRVVDIYDQAKAKAAE